MDRDREREIEWDCQKVRRQYYHHVDQREYDEAVLLFTPDIHWHVMRLDLHGRDAVRGAFGGLTDATIRHVLTNTVVTVIDEAHAIGAIDPKPHFYTSAFPDRLMSGESISLGYMGLNINYGAMAVRKGDLDFLNYLDTWIRVRQLHGWLDKRKAYWFESDAWFEQIDMNPLNVK